MAKKKQKKKQKYLLWPKIGKYLKMWKHAHKPGLFEHFLKSFIRDADQSAVRRMYGTGFKAARSPRRVQSESGFVRACVHVENLTLTLYVMYL